MPRKWISNLDGLSESSNRICRNFLRPLWADPAPRAFDDLDEIQQRVLGLLTRTGYIEKNSDGLYELGQRSLDGEPA